MRTTTFFVLVSSFLFACGGSDGTTPIPAAQQQQQPPGSQGTSTTPGQPPPDEEDPPEPSACNTLQNDAQAITAIAVVANTAPLATGGTIPSGTFHLAEIALYAGKSGKAASIPITLQGTVKVTGSSVEQVLDGKRPDGTIVAERSTESLSVSDNEVTFTKTCDGTGSRTATFTASSTYLTMYLVNDVGQTVGYTYR